MGLQAVDGLVVSDCLRQAAACHIQGELTTAGVEASLEAHHRAQPAQAAGNRTREADLVAVRIVSLLSGGRFGLTAAWLLAIHGRLFAGIYGHAGRLRTCNISKSEPVLAGASVRYADAGDIWPALEYDLAREKKFAYGGRRPDEIIGHLAVFAANLWQIHPFREGNTRTTAVFLIGYLRALGFEPDLDVFAGHSRYFRNALVRANYDDARSGVRQTTQYLEAFLRNLLLGEDNGLDNRDLAAAG